MPRTLRNAVRVATASLVVVTMWAVAGCSHEDENDKPERAVEMWLDAMRNLRGDGESAKVAYDLLAHQARSNLQDRAKRASAGTGQHTEPEQMLVPYRFRVRFPVKSMESRLAGNRAIVVVKGSRGVAEVPCVKEDEHWRVDLDIPRLPAMEKRPEPEL